MQLTPRTLVMACAAILGGGAVFGAFTTLMPSVGLPSSPTAASEPPTGSASADALGDEEITFPAAPAPASSAWPTPGASSPSPAITTSSSQPGSPTAGASPAAASPAATTRRSAVASPSPSTSTTPPKVRVEPRTATTATPPATTTPRPGAERPATRRPAPAPLRTTVRGGWSAPGLRVGSNAITLPRLTSGATVRVTVGCSPSSACEVTGDQLVIDPAATAVTVTWWAPARAGYRAWQVSRAL